MNAKAPAPGTYRIKTLGCKANLYDSRRLAEALEALGLRPAGPDESPEVCLVNTCTVTAAAGRKSRKAASRLARLHPGARLYATGCHASACPEDAAGVPGVTAVYGRDEWQAMLADINGGAPPPDCAGLSGDFGVTGFGGRARAFQKIQEGCDSGCSYCILPLVRGAPRSRPLAQVRAEALRLVRAGFAEIIFTGIHLGLYGRDLDGVRLADAVREVAAIPGLERLRLSSIEAAEVDGPLLKAMQHPAVCAHLHLPLQSGDAGVLARMNRRHTPEQFMASVGRARAALDRPAITTDVMAGFPGETDAEFGNTVALCRQVRFSRLHIFPFSPRPGTPAAAMPGAVLGRVVRERVGRLGRLARELACEWADGFVGRRERVLFERRSAAGRLGGYSDRYVRVSVAGGAEWVGRTAHVVCTGRRGTSLTARLADAPGRSQQ